MSLKRIGIAADHGGYFLKEYLKNKLIENDFKVTDFGNTSYEESDDFPDYVVPMALAVAGGDIFRGIAVCGSGVGASIAVNKIKGIRASLINENFSAHQGVEDDNMNVMCLGGKVIGNSLAWEVVRTFLEANFSGEERHKRRLAKIAKLE